MIGQLKGIHNSMSLPTISRWHQELAAVEDELKLVRAESEQLRGLLNRRKEIEDGKNFSQFIVLSNNLVSLERQQQFLAERKRTLAENLNSQRTFETDSLGEIEISQKPVFPKKSLFGLAGFFVGLLVGLIGVIVRRSKQGSLTF